MANPPILIFGSTGQIGRALTEQAGNLAISLDRKTADFEHPETIIAALEQYNPDIVINATAYTAVDQAESEPEKAERINATTIETLANYCAKNNICLIHYSTDYVFPGIGEIAQKETDQTGPINTYGKTKLMGEQAIQRAKGPHLIFRTSWVYDAHGKNFPNTMLHLAKTKKELSIVSDQIGAPSYAPNIADITLKIATRILNQQPVRSGIYHLCNQGAISWYEFANLLFKRHHINIKTIPITTAEYPTPAERPLNSRLDCSKIESLLGQPLPTIEDGLNNYTETKKLEPVS